MVLTSYPYQISINYINCSSLITLMDIYSNACTYIADIYSIVAIFEHLLYCDVISCFIISTEVINTKVIIFEHK